MDCSVVIAVWFSFEFETPSPIFVILSSFVLERGEFKAAERLIATALSGNPPEEIAEELKDSFIQINLRPYL